MSELNLPLSVEVGGYDYSVWSRDGKVVFDDGDDSYETHAIPVQELEGVPEHLLPKVLALVLKAYFDGRSDGEASGSDAGRREVRDKLLHALGIADEIKTMTRDIQRARDKADGLF